jgi:glucose/arabinose dehydrogenase
MLSGAAANAQQARTIETRSGPVQVEVLAQSLQNPWGMAFLDKERMLVTERPGRLRIMTLTGEISQPIKGVPQVFARGQGGLLDVALSPDFSKDRLVYLTFAEPGPNSTAGTALARGRLNANEDKLEDTAILFRQQPKVDGGQHFGSRIAFSRDGYVFVTTGDRGKMTPAQDPSTHIGAVVRIARDGSVPKDNPFIGKAGARSELWSHGHRNIQGAAIHPQTGALWLHEMGPRGGDEVNIARAGKNYGWPLVSWGDHYDGRDIPDPPTRPEFEGSLHVWKPAVAPSGMAFYAGALFPDWRGSLLAGALVGQGIVRLTLDGERVTGEERIRLGARIRDVKIGPDGPVYALTDEGNGKLIRLSPK